VPEKINPGRMHSRGVTGVYVLTIRQDEPLANHFAYTLRLMSIGT
jgi:hypothetical protein